METSSNKPSPISHATWPHLLGAFITVTLCLCIILLKLGVHVSDSVRYSIYLCVTTFAPGIALLRWTTREKISLLRLICVGAALGYCLEAFVFMSLSTLNLRVIWPIYPIIGIMSLLGLLWHWHGTGWRTSVTIQDKPGILWTKAVSICVVVVVYMTYNAWLGSFSNGHALIPVTPDLLLHLSTAAEIKHHWPVTDPRLAGFTFSYHYLTHVHIAAASLITGIDLQTILFRLYLVPLLVLVVLNTFLLTQVFTRLKSIQLLAVIMVFFSGTVSLAFFSGKVLYAFFSGKIPLALGDPWALTGSNFSSGANPSLIYGLVLFLPLVLETLTVMDKGFHPRWRLLIIGLLSAGSMLAKGSLMPVFAFGLILSALWLRLLSRNEWLNVIKIVGMSLILCIPLYFCFFHQYWNGGAPPPELRLFAIVTNTDIWSRCEPALRSLWEAGTIKSTIDWTFRGIALLLASIIVAVYFIISFGPRLLGIGFLFCRHGWRMSSDKIVMICLICGSFVPSYLFSIIDDNQMHFLNASYPLAGIMGALGLGQLILDTKFRPRRLIWQVLGISMLFISTWNSVYSFWTVYRIKNVPATLVYSVEVLKTSDVYTAQRWIQSNTPTNSVLAVSLFSEENSHLARRCDYSAFTERRLFLEGSHYQRGRDPDELAFRRKLLANIFQNGDGSALRLLRKRFLVTHLVVDNSDSKPVNLPDVPLTLVFQNKTVQIYTF